VANPQGSPPETAIHRIDPPGDGIVKAEPRQKQWEAVNMKIGVGLPGNIPWIKSTDLLEWARRADAGPFSSLGIIDRLVYGNYESLIALTGAAAVTRRIRLTTTILLAPLRSPALLAKQAATLDALSGGRLTLGMGVGSREDDFRAAQAGYKNRGKRFDEQIAIMKRIWDGEPMSGEVGPIGPAPARKGGPEILLGGYSPAAVQRAARLADGFITGGVGIPSRAGQTFQAVAKAWEEAGRPGKPRFVSAVYAAVGEDPAGEGSRYLRDYYGAFAERIVPGLLTTPQAVVDIIHGFADAGADELILWPTVPELEQLDRLTEIVSKAG
jgi:alkanesulfonate monooxygenase SsuD/methylene tetrahydromethanopterin reductase-like flavin-dependent oxidoreductase (luciferase family)